MKTIEQQIKQFKEETGFNLEIKDGKPHYDGYLYLQDTQITALPDNLTVGGYLYLQNIQITELPDNLTVGGYLYLQDTQITALPDNLVVGGSLDLQGTQITELPDNLVVGGYLDLRGTQITALPDNLTVGGYLYLQGTQITDTSMVSRNVPEILHWQWNNKHYIKVDGIFSEVVSHKGNLYKTKQIGKKEIGYLITDGNGKWSHGATIQEAKADLIYKVSNRDKSQYENLSLDDTLTFEEAIAAYRVITGACSAGTRDFVENRLPKPHKEKYTIREIIELTKSEYQSETFKQFFNK